MRLGVTLYSILSIVGGWGSAGLREVRLLCQQLLDCDDHNEELDIDDYNDYDVHEEVEKGKVQEKVKPAARLRMFNLQQAGSV